MDDPNRLCQEDIHTTSDDVPAPSTASIIDEDNKNLDAFLIQDPQQLLELELIHAVPKDPVLDVIFRHLDSQALHKHVAVYLKINFIKLAAIHAMKETDQKEADLVLSLQALEVDTTKFTIYARDEPAQKANKAARALTQKHKRVTKKSALQLNWFIRHSAIQVPNVYRRTNVDDLCAVWYAINSDSHYSCSESLGPCHPLEFRVLVITHLHLIGGTPSQHKILKKPKRTSYQHFLDLLPGFLSMARCSQTGRLGYSTKAPTTGPWLLQSASSLEALDVDRWTTLCEETYDVLRRDTSQVVFLVHADDQAMPSRIAAKVQSCPPIWNSWSVARTTTRDGPQASPPLEFLPGLLVDSMVTPSRPTDAPGATTFSLATRPASKRAASQVSGDKEQSNKKPKSEA